MIRTAFLLTLAASVATPALAQEAAPAQIPAIVSVAPVAAASNGCELHVWPAERFQAMTTGLLGGGLIDAAMHAEGDKARRSHLASALDSEGQLAALQSLDLDKLLKLKGATIITHADPLDRKTMNKIKTRRAESTSTCYSELVVADVFYQKAAIYGRSLRTLFMVRDFGAKKSDPAIYKTWGGNGLSVFPAKPGTDTTAADAELVDVFKKNFIEASNNFANKRSGGGAN